MKNAPYVDCSYKLAGGGFLSNVRDLVQFGNCMLYSYQQKPETRLGYLKSETMQTIWTPVENTKLDWLKNSTGGGYGMGWGVVPSSEDPPFSRDQQFFVSHTGGAIGASSVLLILPTKEHVKSEAPHGVVVAMIANLQSTGLSIQALEIAKVFSEISDMSR